MTRLIQLLKAISEHSYVQYMGEPFDMDVEICKLEMLEQQLADYKKRIEELEYLVNDNRSRAEEIIDSRENQISNMQNRIDELEAPRSCGGCKHYEEWISALGKIGVGDCLHDTARLHVCDEVPEAFYCKYYEPKDK